MPNEPLTIECPPNVPSPHAGSLLALSEQVERGFPLEALYEWQERIAPGRKDFMDRIVAPGTLKRRIKHGGPLSSVESEKLQRAVQAWTAAIDTYREDSLARAFLHKPHALLEHKTPLDVAVRNDPGLAVVKGILGRLKHGTAA